MLTVTHHADLHAAALRQDDQRLAVRGGDALRGAAGRDQHLLDVQADLAEAAAQRAEVLHAAVRAGPGRAGLPRDPPEHGGGRHGRPRRRRRRARRELVPEQGGRSRPIPPLMLAMPAMPCPAMLVMPAMPCPACYACYAVPCYACSRRVAPTTRPRSTRACRGW